MRPTGIAALGAIIVGVALLVDAVLHGRAVLSLVFIVPVLSGGSVEFLLGAALLVVGLFLLPLAFWEPAESEPLPPPPEGPGTTSPGPASASGGVVLIGPIPIFFGGWKNASSRVRLLAAIVGAVVLVVFVVGFVLTAR